MGSWAANRDKGIRNYVYSLDKEVNPSTYKTLDKPGYWGVHAIGEVWAEILWVVEQRLIAKHGFSETLFPPSVDADSAVRNTFYRADKPLVPKHGNSLLVQLVVNGMKLQPCSPSFFDARDAIVQADQVLTGGENFCDLWEGFAERGLGIDANVKGRTPWGGGVREDVSSNSSSFFVLSISGFLLICCIHRATKFQLLVVARKSLLRSQPLMTPKMTAVHSGAGGSECLNSDSRMIS